MGVSSGTEVATTSWVRLASGVGERISSVGVSTTVSVGGGREAVPVGIGAVSVGSGTAVAGRAVGVAGAQAVRSNSRAQERRERQDIWKL
jgi:hypothetical protein